MFPQTVLYRLHFYIEKPVKPKHFYIPVHILQSCQFCLAESLSMLSTVFFMLFTSGIAQKYVQKQKNNKSGIPLQKYFAAGLLFASVEVPMQCMAEAKPQSANNQSTTRQVLSTPFIANL